MEMDGLKECMELTVPIVGDVAVIEQNLVALNADKEEVTLDPDERKELATLFLVKGGMSGVTKRSKEMEDKVKEAGSPWMLARGVKMAKVPGIGTMSVTEGTNVSISQENLRKVLLKYGVRAETVPKIVAEAIKKTPYITIQFIPDKVTIGPAQE